MHAANLYETVTLAARFATDLAWKATVLFAATGVLLLLLRRQSAAARHLVGTAGLGASLLLPILSLLPEKLALAAVSLFRLLPSAPNPKAFAVRVAVGLWLLGALVVAVRLFVGWARVDRIARFALPIRDADWIEERDALALRLAVRREVALKESPAVPSAMTAGVFRPLLLIGRAARQWAVERRRVVLLHELAHIKRLDWISVLVAEFAVALYWFHPLVWWLNRRVRRDAESASDDLVLASGVKPSVYAGHLLGIFRSLGSPAHPVAPALALTSVRPSHFEERLRAILDPAGSRLSHTTAGARLAAAGLLAGAVGVAATGSWKAPCRGATPGLAHAASMTTTIHTVPAKAACATKAAEAATVLAQTPEEVEATPGSPETLQMASVDEVAPAESSDAEAPALSAETPEPDAVVHAVREAVRENVQALVAGFVKASNGHRRDGGDWYGRGMELHRAERYPEAIEAFQHSIDAGYREDAASYNIACGYALLGKRDEAFRWLDQARDAGFDVAGYLSDDDLENLHTDPRWASLKKAARADEAGEKKHSAESRAAVARFERLSSGGAAEKSGEPFFRVGRDLLAAERYDLAAKAYQTAAERGYRTGTSLYNEACALSLGGDKSGALDRLGKALEAGFDQPDLFRTDDDLDNVRGEARFAELAHEARDLSMPVSNGGIWGQHRERSKWRASARRYEEYAQKHPETGRAWYNLGYASLAADRPEQAVEAFQKALNLSYRRDATMYNLACSYAHLDQKDLAFDWLFKAIDAGFDQASTIRRDEDLDNLRGDPRYRKALEIARARQGGSESD